MVVGGSLVLMQGRSDAWASAIRSSDNLRLALDRDIARNLRTIDLSIQGVNRALATRGIDEAAPAVRRQALFDTAATAEDLGGLLIRDASGQIVETSTPSIRRDAAPGDPDASRSACRAATASPTAIGACR